LIVFIKKLWTLRNFFKFPSNNKVVSMIFNQPTRAQ
jgi:hypothetical protein